MPKPKIFTTILLVALSTTVFTSLGLSFLALKATPLAQAPTSTDRKSEADRLFEQGRKQYRTSQLSAAIQSWEQALSIYREIGNRQWESITLMSLGFASNDLGQYQKVIDYFTQSLAIFREFGIRTGEKSSLDYLGNAYRKLGQYQKAIDYFTQSLTIARNIGDRNEESNSLYNLGLPYNDLGQYQKAIDYFTQSLAIFREIGNRLGESNSLMNMGNAYDGLGQYQKAIGHYTQSLIIFREIGDRNGESNSLHNLGLSFLKLGQYQKAIDSYTHSIAIFREIGNRYGEGGSLMDLGNTYDSLGQYQKASECFIQSIAIFREIGERNEEMSSLYNLGNAYNKLGQYQKAIDSYTQSLTIARDIGDRNDESSSLNRLGQVYNSLGQYQKAIDYLTQSFTIASKIGDQDGKSNSLANLGSTYNYLGQYQKAIDYHTQSLGIKREIGDRLGESNILMNLGSAYYSLGQYQKAIDYYTQSLTIFREIGDRSGVSHSLNNLGLGYNSLGQYQRAIDYYTKSLAIKREISDRLGVSSSLNNLGNAYKSLGQYQKAIDYYTQSLIIFREIGSRLGVGMSLSNLGLTFYEQNNFLFAEKNLLDGIKIWESLRDVSGDNANKISIFEEQARTYRTLQQVLIAQNKITEALEISERGRARALVDLLSRQLSTIPTSAATLSLPTIEQIKQIAKSQNATLVQYSVINDGREESELYIWAIKPTGEIAFEKVDLKVALQSKNLTLESLVTISRDAVGVRGRIPMFQAIVQNPVNQETQAQNLKKLYDILIKPIANQLPSDPNAHVIFMPQGALFLVPFSALQDEQGKYLIEKHTIRTAPAIQVLQLTQKRRQELISSGVKDTLVVGNPTMPSVGEIGDTQQQLKSLPGAEAEAEAIAPLLNTKAIIGKFATKASVVQKMPTARIIHLATHGLLDDFKGLGVPGAIALAPSGTDDGLLRADEILDMKLNAELVVLSACDTGRGEITGDGVIGLSRSLISAGVPSIIVSLWAVPDAPTGYLMKEFYQNLQKNPDKAQALRQAMLKTMKQNPSPRDWAAFTLIGEAN